MTKAEIVREIARRTGNEKQTVLECVEAFMDTVKDHMSKGGDIYLRGFGSFIVKTRAAKLARNISAGETILIPEHKIPAFKPSKHFLKMM